MYSFCEDRTFAHNIMIDILHKIANFRDWLEGVDKRKMAMELQDHLAGEDRAHAVQLRTNVKQLQYQQQPAVDAAASAYNLKTDVWNSDFDICLSIMYFHYGGCESY